MAIEPLASAMTFNVQQSQPAPVVQRATETMEGQSIENNAPKVDDQTLTVAKTQSTEDDENEKNDNQGNQSNSNAVDQELMKKAFEELNKKSVNFESEFGIHEKTNRITVKIVDKKTKEVIRELPPEKMLDMIAKVWEMAGLVVDEKR